MQKVLKQPACLKISIDVNKVDLASKLINRSFHQQFSKSFRIQPLPIIVEGHNFFIIFQLWMIFILSKQKNGIRFKSKWFVSLSSTSLREHFWKKALCEHCTSSVILPRNFLKKEKHRSYVCQVIYQRHVWSFQIVWSECCFIHVQWWQGAANLQLLLIHIEYEVKLLNHDFFIGPQHKLIPTNYGICEITNTDDVS